MQEKSHQEKIRERSEQAEEAIVDEFAAGAKEAAQRLRQLAKQDKNKTVAFLAAKRIVDDFRGKEGPKVIVNNQPTFVSNLGLPPAPTKAAIAVTVARKQLKPAPKAIPVIVPEAAERPEFTKGGPAGELLGKQSFDVTKVVAPTPDRPQSQVIDFPAIRPPQVAIPDDPKAE